MLVEWLHVTFQGFLASLVLIVAIGSQNAYVLKCSIKNNYPYQVAFACFFGDIILMNLGVFGLAQLLVEHQSVLVVIRWIGIVFVITYGCLAIREVFYLNNKLNDFSHAINDEDSKQTKSNTAWKAVLIALSFTFLNPHVYLDTIFIIGNLGIQYPADQRFAFVVGCLLASAVWFFSLSSSGKLLSKILSGVRVWQCIELSVAAIMFYIAYKLIYAPIC